MRVIFIIILAFISSTIWAQSSSYITQMEHAVAVFEQVDSKRNYQSNLQEFEQISLSYPTEWLPIYYAALLKTKMCSLKMGDPDLLADQAISLVQKAKKLQVNNDELLCAESIAYAAKMAIKPMLRWLQFEHKIKAPLVAVKKINKDNPSVYVLEAILQYRMPVLLGGGCAKAYPLAVIAMQKLQVQAKQSRSYILPHWGHGLINEMLSACK